MCAGRGENDCTVRRQETRTYNAETEDIHSRPGEPFDGNIMHSHVGEFIRCRVFVSIKHNQGKWVQVNERQILVKYKELSSTLSHVKLEWNALGNSELPKIGAIKAEMLEDIKENAHPRTWVLSNGETQLF